MVETKPGFRQCDLSNQPKEYPMNHSPNTFPSRTCLFIAVLFGCCAVLSLSSCSKKASDAIIGKWRAQSTKETVEFRKDGTLINPQNEKQNGKFTFTDGSHMNLQINTGKTNQPDNVSQLRSSDPRRHDGHDHDGCGARPAAKKSAFYAIEVAENSTGHSSRPTFGFQLWALDFSFPAWLPLKLMSNTSRISRGSRSRPMRRRNSPRNSATSSATSKS